MAGDGDKQVRLKFIVDQASVQQARQAMGQLISDATKLADALKRASVGGGGGGGNTPGGMNLGMGGGTVTTGGAQNSQQVLAQQAATPGQRMVASLAENSRALKGLAQGSSDALRTMSDALRRSVDDQKRSVDALQSRLVGLLKTYKDLSEVRPGQAPLTQDEQDLREVRQRRISKAVQKTMGRLETEQGTLTQLEENKALVDPKSPPKPTQQSMWTKDMSGGAFGALGRAVGPLAIANMGVTAISGQMDWQLNQKMLYGQQAAARGAVWSPNMRRAMAGDLSLGLSQDAMNKDKDYQDLSRSLNLVKTIGVKNAIGATGGVGGIISSLLNSDKMGTDIKFAMDDTMATTKLMSMMTESQGNWEKGEGAHKMALAERFQANMAGKLSWMHATGQDYKYNQRTHEADVDRIGRASVIRQAQGFSDEEYMGAFGQVQGVAGRHAANALATQSMYGVASGIGNAGQIAGMAAITGGLGKGGPEFMQALYAAQGGKGGYDPGALAQLGIGLAGESMNTGIATSGVGTLNALLAGAGGGTGGPADMLQIRNMQAGMQGLGNLTSGGIDRYQSGMNVLNAGKNLGAGASPYAIDYLANKMTPQQMMDSIYEMKHGGKGLDPKLTAIGITPDAIKKQFASLQEGVFGRYQMGQGGTQADKVMAEFRASGLSAADFYKQSKHKAYTRVGLEAAVGVAQGNLGLGPGEIDAFLGIAGGKGARGGPRGVAGTHGPETDAQKDLLKAQLDNVDLTLQMGKKLGAINKDYDQLQKKYAGLTENLSSSAEGAANALRDLEAAAASLAVAQGGSGARAAVNKFKTQYQGKRNDLLAYAKTLAPGLERSEAIEAANEMGAGAKPMTAYQIARQALGHDD